MTSKLKPTFQYGLLWYGLREYGLKWEINYPPKSLTLFQNPKTLKPSFNLPKIKSKLSWLPSSNFHENGFLLHFLSPPTSHIVYVYLFSKRFASHLNLRLKFALIFLNRRFDHRLIPTLSEYFEMRLNTRMSMLHLMRYYVIIILFWICRVIFCFYVIYIISVMSLEIPN